jgi:hypothetical protein
MSFAFRYRYITEDEIEFLNKLHLRNPEAFDSQARMILEDRREYGPGVDVEKLKDFIAGVYCETMRLV